GHFNPALPYSAEELSHMGFDLSDGRYTVPPAYPEIIHEFFGDRADEVLHKCVKDGHLRPFCSTQRKVAEKFAGEENAQIREGLMNLIDDVLFVEDPRRKGFWHPRIGAQNTVTYRNLDQWHKDAYNRMYDDFFYRRHNDFWRESAMRKLPDLLAATDMLSCGEDLGMIPDCVPQVMKELQILSLEIETMPKLSWETFANVAAYPYLSVCTTSTHDMNPLRAWWEEDRGLSAKYYHEVLGHDDDAPYFCEPWICSEIVRRHLNSPSMLCILPLSDWLSTDGAIRRENPNEERINIPAIPRYYWRYRMHLSLEALLSNAAFNASLREMITSSGR
ncbi:MAG: 4-alpha-glucanotransferase, partial [Bacteroidales bacterium]|nr:4-alpha-glucanotransferase [Bacteroidales bacterium]